MNTQIQKLIAAVTKAHNALDCYLDAVATVDSGIANAKGDEPGVGLARDIEWSTNSRLNFIATKLPESQRWYDISEQAYVNAVTAKDSEQEQGVRNGPQSEFSNADEQLYKAQRYMEVAAARHLPMLAEFNHLKAVFATVTGKDWVQGAKTATGGGVTVDKSKMKVFLADRFKEVAAAKTAAA